MAEPAWEFVFVLPNLSLASSPGDPSAPGSWPEGLSFAPAYMAVAAHRDPRVEAMRTSNPAVHQILNSFKNEMGRPYDPAVLIVRSDAPESVSRSLEAIVAFRNAVALAIVLRTRANESGTGLEPLWSDTFDFHSVQLGGRGGVILQSPALLSVIGTSQPLHLTSSPYVSVVGKRLWVDKYLFDRFGKVWMQRFAPRKKNSEFSRVLFRSLESAYHACSIGARNEGSLQDYGIQVATWVSAIETLAWPARRYADLEAALRLLKTYPSSPRSQRRRYVVKVRGKKRGLTALQRSYVYMYTARNAFLHGNPVSGKTLMTVSRGERVGIPRLCALVYRAALVAYLNDKFPKRIASFADLAGPGGEMFDDAKYERTLAKLLGFRLDED